MGARHWALLTTVLTASFLAHCAESANDLGETKAGGRIDAATDPADVSTATTKDAPAGGAADTSDDGLSAFDGGGGAPDAGQLDSGSLDASLGPGSLSCADVGKYVFVIDKSDVLVRFDPTIPSQAAFTAIGPMGCSFGQGPNSMAIDRQGRAWVLYGTWVPTPQEYDCAGVFAVDVTTGNCLGKTPVVCGSAGFDVFGMAFVADSEAGSADSLYLANYATPSLGHVDAISGQVTSLGPLPYPAELTGNANGELWGFFPGVPIIGLYPALHQLDTATGQMLATVSLTALAMSDAGVASPMSARNYAVAFWGGDFYVFFEIEGYDPSTNVWKVSPSGAIEKYVTDSGWHIVGAGVSTCAPTIGPS